jgi:hypothetical protein
MPYIPPNMRVKGLTPKKLTVYKTKVVDEKPLMTKQELFESIRLKEYGKADGAWFGDGGS